MKNITLAIPEELLEKSRAYAKRHGTTLNAFVRELLQRYVNQPGESPVDQLLRISNETRVSTQSWQWNRDELYDRQIFS